MSDPDSPLSSYLNFPINLQHIGNGCLHHMTSNMNNFLKFNSDDGGILRVGNNVAFHIKGLGFITLDGKTNIDDIYFFHKLKHNVLSVG